MWKASLRDHVTKGFLPTCSSADGEVSLFDGVEGNRIEPPVKRTIFPKDASLQGDIDSLALSGHLDPIPKAI